MRAVHRLFLVALVFFAQVWAGAHAVEHALGNGDGLPPHVCELCLAMHDLGSALPSLALPPPILAGQVEVEVLPRTGRGALPPLPARQRGPPNT